LKGGSAGSWARARGLIRVVVVVEMTMLGLLFGLVAMDWWLRLMCCQARGIVTNGVVAWAVLLMGGFEVATAAAAGATGAADGTMRSSCRCDRATAVVFPAVEGILLWARIAVLGDCPRLIWRAGGRGRRCRRA
jgi:hypothetical protein